MATPVGLVRFLRPGTGLAGSAFWGGRGLEKSWGESHRPHSRPRGAYSKEMVPNIITDQNQMRKKKIVCICVLMLRKKPFGDYGGRCSLLCADVERQSRVTAS